MEDTNTPVVQTPASVATPEADFDLGTYRATREAKTPAKEPAKVTAPSQETAEAAGAQSLTSDDVPEAEATPEQLEAKKKKLGGFQKTISKQSDEIADLKRQLANGATAPAAAKPAEGTSTAAPAAVAATPDYEKVKAKPKLEDCADLAEFTEKTADWTSDKRDWLKDQRTKADTQKAAATTLTDNWKAKTAEFKVENPDYDAVMVGVDDVKLSPLHQALFLESENGVALAYQLAQDPDELRRIAALPPLKAAVEIGKLEAAFAKQAKEQAAPEPEIKVSGAPKPFKPVNGAMTRGTPDVSKLSLDDYRKARESGRIQ